MATPAAAGVACLRLLVSGREAAREELEAVGVGGRIYRRARDSGSLRQARGSYLQMLRQLRSGQFAARSHAVLV